jgi:hypothetical protein
LALFVNSAKIREALEVKQKTSPANKKPAEAGFLNDNS